MSELCRRISILAALIVAMIALAWVMRTHPPAAQFKHPSRDALLESPAKASASVKGAGRIPGDSMIPPPDSRGPHDLKDLQDALRADDICAAMLILHGPKAPSAEDVLDAIWPAAESVVGSTEAADRQLLGAFSKNELYAEALDAKATDERIEFYQALIFGGLMNTSIASPLNEKRAIRMLEDLEARDPGNGAYSAYLASLYSRTGAPSELVREALLRSMRAPVYDDFERALVRKLADRGLSQATRNLLTRNVLSRLNTADKTSVLGLTRMRISGDDTEFTEAARDFSLRRLAPGNQNQGRQEFVHWSAVDHQVALATLKDAWRVLTPENPLPEAARHYTELLQKPIAPANDAEAKERARLDRALTEFLARRGPCPKALLLKMFEGDIAAAASLKLDASPGFNAIIDENPHL